MVLSDNCSLGRFRVNLIILKHNLTLMQNIFGRTNVPWSGPQYKQTTPRAFYIQFLNLTLKDIVPADAEDFPGTLPRVDLTQPLFSGEPYQVIRADEVSIEEAPRVSCSKFVCTFWHPTVSITNEKMYIWVDVVKAYKTFDTAALQAIVSAVDRD